MTKTKLVCGVGVNDADYIVRQVIDGKYTLCPYYKKWASMLSRCYRLKLHKNFPTYSDCYVCEEWLLFSNFRKWMEAQDWQGKYLDKDILVPGNKEYSPDKCLFVSNLVNCLLVDSAAIRGKWPQGVSYKKAISKFTASIKLNNKQKHLGCFDSAEEASEAYKKAKAERIKYVANLQSKQIKEALYNHANLISGAA